MLLTYLGHSCFKIETKPNGRGANNEKLTVIIDPFDDAVGLKPPAGKADLALTTHAHHDHAYLKRLKDYFLIDSPGEYTFRGISITGIKSFHDQNQGADRGLNTIFTLESEGIRLCHLGDLGHVLDKNQIDQLGEINVLMIPVGGHYTIGPKEAIENIKLIEPSLIIPMHYQQPRVKIQGLAPVADFYQAFGTGPAEKNQKKINLKPNQFKEEETRLIEMSY